MGIPTMYAGLAYIGPGPGLSMTWALIALAGTVLSVIAAVLLWPLRMLLRKVRPAMKDSDSSEQRSARDDPSIV